MTNLEADKEREIVAAIRRCEVRAAEAEAATDLANERYWTGVAYGINHGMRIVFGTRIGDRIMASVIAAERADEKAREKS